MSELTDILNSKNEDNNEEKVEKEQDINTPQNNNPVNTLNEIGQISPPALRRNPRGNIQFMTIIGQIEGHMVSPPQNKTTKYEHVIPLLADAADNMDVDGLLILLNTVGGDVEAGLALSELISGLGKPTVSLVIGGGHSIGVPLAVASDYSFIAPSATMIIHPIRMSGLVVGAQQTFDYFDKMQQRVLNFITENSSISKERLTELMSDTKSLIQDVGTILIGEQAVKEGLINEVGGLANALEKIYTMIEKDKKRKEAKKPVKRKNG